MGNDKPPSVVITGASSGIGAATALHLARHGWWVFAGVRRAVDGESLRSQFLSSSGADCDGPGSIQPIILDVTREHDIHRAVDNVQAQLAGEPLRALVNNAGWLCLGPLEVVPMDDIRRQFDVNFFGVLQTTRAFLPALRQSRGRIVHVSSISGRSALPFMGAYAASKFALEAMADSMRIELHRWGIKVCLIEPGAVETPLLDKNQQWLNHLESQMTGEEAKLYARDLVTIRHIMDDSTDKAMPVQRVVEAITRALTSRRPKARYRLGSGTSGLRFLEDLPTGLRDWLIRFKMRRAR